jgi:hypothetical protein
MSRKSVCLSLVLVLICGAALVVPASGQRFVQITGSLTHVAAGRAEVWGLNASNQPYRFNPATKAFVHASTPSSLTQVAVGGGTALQSDAVWALNSSGHIFVFNFGTKAFVKVPGILSQIVVGEGDQDVCHAYEVWGIAPDSTVWRYNYCTGGFDQIVVPKPFTHIATGGGVVWGLDEFAQIYVYNFQLPQWVQVSGGFAGTLQQITVGVNDAWGLDGNGVVYRFDPNGASFVQWPVAFDQIAAGGNGVWGILNGDNRVYRLDYSSSRFVFLDLNTSGVAQIAVGYGGGVWLVNSSHQVFTFVRP